MSYDDYAAMLSRFDDDFDDLPVYQGALPDGTYHARITEARVERADWGGLQFFMRFEAVDGPHEGGTVSKYTTLDDDDPELRATRHGFVKSDLITLGFDTTDDQGDRVCSIKLSDLADPRITAEIVGKVVVIKVARKPYVDRNGEDKTRINVYINKLIQTEPTGKPY